MRAQGVHDWVVSNIPYDVRAGVMDNAVSNTAVLVSYVGITSCLTLGALFDVREALRKATLMYAAFAQAGGLIW